MIRTYRTFIWIFRIYKCSNSSENNNKGQGIENFTHCQVSEKKREFLVFSSQGNSGCCNIKEYKSDLIKIEMSTKDAMNFFKMVKNIIKLYRPVYLKIIEAKIEAKETNMTFVSLENAARNKKEIQWKMISEKKRFNSDLIYDQRINLCRKGLKYTLQRIYSLLKHINNDYLYIQLDIKQKTEFYNFTSDKWGPKFNKMIMDACGYEFVQEIEGEINKFKAYRVELWENDLSAKQKSYNSFGECLELKEQIRRKEEQCSIKLLLSKKLAYLKRSKIMKIIGNKKKLAAMDFFSPKQRLEYYKKYLEERAEDIFEKGYIKKQLAYYDIIDNLTICNQHYMLTEAKDKIVNEKLDVDEKIKNFMPQDYNFLGGKIYILHYNYFKEEFEKMLKFPYNIKCLLLEKFKKIEEQSFFDTSTLEKKFELKKESLPYQKEKKRRKILDSRIKLIEVLKDDCNSFDRENNINKYKDILCNMKNIEEDLALDIIYCIIDTIKKPSTIIRKFKYIFGEMETNVDFNIKNIFWSLCDEKEFKYEKDRIFIPRSDGFKREYHEIDEIIVNLVEQLFLENLIMIENELKSDVYDYDNIKSKILILKCNINYKSPICVSDKLFEVTNEISNIIYKILVDEIFFIEKNTMDIFEAAREKESNFKYTGLKIERFENIVSDDEDNLCNANDKKKSTHLKDLHNKWNAQLAIYWDIVYKNTAVSFYKKNRDNVKTHLITEDKTLINLEADFQEFMMIKKKFMGFIEIKYEIIFIWFSFYMRTYTCYLLNVYLGSVNIPKRKLDEILVEYNIWEYFMEYACFYYRVDDLISDEFTFVNLAKNLDWLKSRMRAILWDYKNELKLLLVDSMVSEKLTLEGS